jgi:hypothetical protein
MSKREPARPIWIGMALVLGAPVLIGGLGLAAALQAPHAVLITLALLMVLGPLAGLIVVASGAAAIHASRDRQQPTLRELEETFRQLSQHR